MTLELVKCTHCGCIYRIDIEKIKEEGITDVVRLFRLLNIKEITARKKARSIYIDITCPNCKKGFEWEVKI